jgi:phytoene synthase
MTTDTLLADHDSCARLLRRSGSSFTLPISLLPRDKRRGTTALYAFCRRADDIVDDAVDPAAAAVALDAFERDLGGALAGQPSADPVIRALVDTVRRFAVPTDHLRAIIAGVRMDLTQSSFATFAELEEYCRRVASAVGLAAVHIWGFRSPRALDVAHECGMAFQLTNILRDIPEDRGRGRIYLPAADIAAAGCRVEDLAAAVPGPGLARLSRMECERARGYFRRAAELDRLLSTDGRIVFRAMFGVYAALLRAVERAGQAIFVRRVRPGKPWLLVAAALAVCAGPGPVLALPPSGPRGGSHG